MRAEWAVALVLLVLNVGVSQQSPAADPLTQTSSPRLAEPSYQADFPPVIANGLVSVRWEHGRMVSYGHGDNGEPVRLYDKSGALIFGTPLAVQSAAKIYVRDVSVSATDTIVVALGAVTRDGTLADLIAEAGRDGIRRAVRTSPFRADKICATDEGNVWAYGWERDSNGNERHGDHAMLREYSFEHGELRSSVRRIEVQPPHGVPVTGTKLEVQLSCGRENVVLLNGAINQVMLYDLQHSRLTKLELPPLPHDVPITSITGSALTPSGELFISTEQSGPPARTGIFHLNLQSQTRAAWDVITLLPANGKWYRLLGSDGETLVYARGNRSPSVYWSAATSSGAAR